MSLLQALDPILAQLFSEMEARRSNPAAPIASAASAIQGSKPSATKGGNGADASDVLAEAKKARGAIEAREKEAREALVKLKKLAPLLEQKIGAATGDAKKKLLDQKGQFGKRTAETMKAVNQAKADLDAIDNPASGREELTAILARHRSAGTVSADVNGDAASLNSSQSSGQSQATGLQSISISPANTLIDSKKPLQFHATGEYPGKTKDLTNIVVWSSSDPSVKIEANSGRASALPVSATAVITATDPDTGIVGTTTVEVAPPEAEPALQAITITPVNPSLAGWGPADFGKEAPTLQFHAVGLFADKSSHDITNKVEWHCLPLEVASIDQRGRVSAEGKSGTATITATDRTSAVHGAAIGASTNLKVTVPTVKSIVIKPSVSSIDAGQKKQFTATRVYSDGSTVDMTDPIPKGYISWSASDGLFVEGNGLVSTRGAHGKAQQLTATDNASGHSATLDLTIEWERSKETPYGKFSYLVHAESETLPLLTKAVQTLAAAKSTDDKLTEIGSKFAEYVKKIGPLKEVLADIDENTDRILKIEATEAKLAENAVEGLTAFHKLLKENSEAAEENFNITQDDLSAASDLVRATALMLKSQEQHESIHRLFELGSAAIEAGVHFPHQGPIALAKPAWDTIGVFFEYFGTHVDPWLEEAEELRKEASDLGMTSAVKKAKAAKKAVAVLKELRADAMKAAKNAEELVSRTKDTPENNFKGKFSFPYAKEAIDVAEKTLALARQTTEAAYGAHEAAAALARPSLAPNEWMANPAQDKHIIDSMLKSASIMYDQAIASREAVEVQLKRFQDTYAAAKDEMSKAPGKDMPGAKKKK
jgi:hypothetical protein